MTSAPSSSSSAFAITVSAAVESITRSFSELCDLPEDHYCFENPRRFSGFSKRLQLILNQLLRSFPPPPETFPSSVQTAIKGISGDLSEAAETVSVYGKRSKIFVLINCKSLCSSLLQHTVAIGGWLALIDSALEDYPDLRKKASDLSRDMKFAQLRVTENEERVHCTLEKEGEGRQTSKAVQSAIIMDLARALGVDPDKPADLSEQIKLFRDDLLRSNSVSELRILVSLERILDTWSIEPRIITRKLDLDIEEGASIAPFKNFLCPLTKEVMEDPVALESSQTYERTAIVYWFERCREDGRDPTCPVTGQVLKSLELKPNIGLAGAIEEWVYRIVDHQVKSAVEHLSEDPISVNCIERVLDNIYKISEEHPSSRYKLRNAGVVLMIVKMLRTSSKIIGAYLRSKAIIALLSMAKDEESRKIMLEAGITRLAIHSLTGRSEKERENAVKLLLEFCSDEEFCTKIASEKGALVLLSSMAGNLEHPSLSNLAEEVLKQMERVEGNVQHLAAAGRFEPLLTRLCEGSDDVKIEMASIVGRMILTNSSKEQIARQSAKILVQLLSKPEGRAPSLHALYNLSGLDDNATILVDSAVLPSLTEILFDDQDPSSELRELAASTIANIVSKPGHWELASADKKGHSMQSENIVFTLLGLLTVSSPRCQVSVLKILCGIMLSPQASELVASHVKAGDGFKTILPFLEHPEVENRIYGFKLTRALSEWFGQDLANEIRLYNKLDLLKDKLLDNHSTDGERSDAACILATLSLSEDEVKTLLGGDFVGWTVNTLKNQRHSTNARISRTESSMLEGLLGILLYFTKTLDQQSLGAVREHHLMTIFCKQLGFPSKARVKQLAALGLKNLSEYRSLTAWESEPSPPRGFCSSLMFMCGRTSTEPSKCPIHNCPCEEDSQLCLLRNNCIKPLLDLFDDDDTSVQIAAVEALSTLVSDTSNSFKKAVDELDRLDVVDAVITLFTEVRSAELQEKALWMVERILRVENHVHRHSLNQSLVRGLVEAFKHGNASTRKHAQDALTNLKQLSGVSGNTSSQTRAQR